MVLKFTKNIFKYKIKLRKVIAILFHNGQGKRTIVKVGLGNREKE